MEIGWGQRDATDLRAEIVGVARFTRIVNNLDWMRRSTVTADKCGCI
jgi:hypothetical protein